MASFKQQREIDIMSLLRFKTYILGKRILPMNDTIDNEN